MSSLTNVNIQSKTMNGLNTINADEITTENFTATNLNATDLTVSGAINLPNNSILDSYLSPNVPLKNQASTFTAINTFSQPPVMSGASIENSTIPVSAINGLSTGYMDLTTNQTVVSGVKTFNVAPKVNKLEMLSTNSTFIGNSINNTTASEGTYIGFQAGQIQDSGASRNTVIGTGALKSTISSNQTTAVGYNALTVYNSQGEFGNTSLGAYALATLRTGSRNIGVGTAAGNGLFIACSNNVAFASDSLSNSSNKTLFNYANISGANVPFANPFIFDPIRFDTSTGTIRARMYVRYYNGELNQAGSSRVESYDSATYTAVLQGTGGARIACIAGSVLRFTQGGTDASIDYYYAGAGGTGTTFTIGTGLGTIPAGFIMVYSTTATMTKWATVSSYNSTTGVLVLTTSITLVAGNINFFASNTDRGSYVNNCCAIGAGALQNFACGQTAPLNGNCGFGNNALNGAGGGYDNASYLAGNLNTAFGNLAGSWCTGNCSNNTFLGANTNVLIPYSLINNSTAIGYNAKLDLSNLIALGTATETVRCWAMDVRGLPDFSSGLKVSAGTITFESNIQGIAPSGDLFQAYKNTGVGNAGHILINGEGNLLYYDTTASAIKWRLDTSGNLVVGNIDLSGTLISKTTTGDFIRSNSNATQFFYASNNGNIGYADSTSSIGVRWNINSNGTARFVSSSNTFKYWEIAGNVFRYYNLGGTYSINMNGDSGAITTPGAISSASLTTTGAISGATLTTTGDISTTLGDVYGVNIQADNFIASKTLDLQGGVGKIIFTGGAQNINIGVGTTVDTTSNNIVIGNGSSGIGGANVVIGNNSAPISTVAGQGCVIVGSESESRGEYSSSLGHNTITGKESVSLGRNASANSIGSVAIGLNSSANSNQGTSIGNGAQSAGTATAIGYNSRANFLSSLAIGYNTQTTADNQIALGNTNNFCLFNGVFYPYELSPNIITTSGLLPTAPYYGIYRLGSTGAIDITLPTITAGMAGIQILFRKTSTPLTSLVRITCSATNTYFPVNSTTSTASGVFTNFIVSGAVVGRVCVIGSAQWAVIT